MLVFGADVVGGTGGHGGGGIGSGRTRLCFRGPRVHVCVHAPGRVRCAFWHVHLQTACHVHVSVCWEVACMRACLGEAGELVRVCEEGRSEPFALPLPLPQDAASLTV